MPANDQFESRYRAALTDYLEHPGDEDALLRALDAGRMSIVEGRGILDILTIHNEFISRHLASAPTGQEALALSDRAQQFLIQAMTPFEMTHRGWVGTMARLTELNATLEQRVESQKVSLRAAEALLRRSHEHLQLAQRLGRIGSIEVDQLTGEIYWSDEVYRLYELDPATVGSPKLEHVINAIHPDDRPAFIEFANSLQAGAVPPPMENRVLLRDGSIRWILRRAEVIADERGVPVKLMLINQDITERKQFEERVKRERDAAQRYLDVAGVMLLVLNVDGTVAQINRKGCSILGYDSADDIIGKHWVDNFIPKRLRDELHEALRRLIGGQDSILATYENPILTRSGEERIVAWQNTVLFGEDGRPIGTLSSGEDITERKRAEEELRRSREHLARAQKLGRIGSVEVDLRTRNEYWSPEIYRLLDLDPTRVERPSVDIVVKTVHPDDRSGFSRFAEALFAGTVPAPTEYRIILGDGSMRWIGLSAEILTDEYGAAEKLLIINQDITERRRAEDELRRSQEHLARVQSVARIGSTEVDLKTQEVVWSDEIYHLLGIDENSVQPGVDAFASSVHPEDRALLRDASLRGRNCEEVGPIEFRVVAPDGATRWFYRIADFIRDAAGQPTRLIATMYDITERKAAEAAYRASAEQYRTTFDLAPLGIAHVAPDGRFLLVNDKICRMFGADREDMIKSNIRSFTYPDDIEETGDRLRRMAAGEDAVVSWEKRYLRRDGGTVWCSISSTLMRDGFGRPAYFVTALEDITARKANEERRIQLEEQLQQSQKMEAVGRLTGGVAHDFNNLLTIILGNLELVREKVATDARLTRQIDSATNAGRRGADLTHRLLAFSRRQPLEPLVIDINKRIAELVPLLRHTIGENIEIAQTLEASLWRVVVDPGQFESAIMNLAVNARDAMPSGGRLEIATENVAVDEAYATQRPGLDTGNYVRVSVSDTGIGMSPDVIEKAFEPFFTTKEVGKGTGLGLSMVYGFVKQSGGHAAIYSEVGIGTTITMLLPASPEQRATIPDRVASTSTGVGSETILVVEDEAEVRNVAVSFLEALGYRTIEAGTVKEGFERFAANTDIAMILTDVILPGGEDGADLARRARALRQGTKVLFMSGYTEDVVMHNDRLDKGVVLLRKPFTSAQLAEKVRSVIDGMPPGTVQ